MSNEIEHAARVRRRHGLVSIAGCTTVIRTDRSMERARRERSSVARGWGLAPRVLTLADLGGCMNACTGHRAVKVLTDHGIETFEFCEGGRGHSMPELTVRFWDPGGGLEGPVGVLGTWFAGRGS
jgi:hypothetical protein